MLAGQTISGFLSSRFGWRFFFFIIPIIGLLSTLALYCICYFIPLMIDVEIPEKGEAENKDEKETVENAEETVKEEKSEG